MTSQPLQFNVVSIEPKNVPLIDEDTVWKKAKDIANDNFKAGRKLLEVLIYYKTAITKLIEKYGVRLVDFMLTRPLGLVIK